MLFEAASAFPFLSLLVGLPFIGILFLSPIDARFHSNIRYGLLWVQGFTFLVALSIALLFLVNAGLVNGERAPFDAFLGRAGDFQFIEKYPWISACSLNLHWGVDFTAVVLLLLATGTFPLATYLCLRKTSSRPHFHAAILLGIEGCLLASLCSLNVLFLLLFSECAYLLFLLIAPDHSVSNLKGRALSSAVLLVLVLGRTFDEGSFSLVNFANKPLPHFVQVVFLVALVLRRPFNGKNLVPTTLEGSLVLLPLFIGDLFLSIRFLSFALNPASTILLHIFLIGLFLQSLFWDFPSMMAQMTLCFIYAALAAMPHALMGNVAGLCFLANYVIGSSGLVFASVKFNAKARSFFSLSLKTVPFSLGFMGHVCVLRALQAQGKLTFALVYLVAVFITLCIPSRPKTDADAIEQC